MRCVIFWNACSYQCRSCCCSDPYPRAMALRLLSRSAVRAGQPCLSHQAAVNVLQRSAQRPRHVVFSTSSSKESSAVVADLDTSPSTSGDGHKPAAANSELPIQRFIWPKLQSKFCRMCGAQMDIIQPDGDKEWRHVCKGCSYIDYFNPKMVVGCVVQHDNKILLCRRGIEPCKGLWTIPAGFMEIGESSAAGAARETQEEANAAVHILGPYAHWDIPVIGQAYILFRAELAAPFTFSAGTESLEVALFETNSIPFDEIAFSSVSITLRHFVDDLASGKWHMHHGVIHRKPDAAPNDPAAFEVRDHFAVPVAASAQ